MPRRGERKPKAPPEGAEDSQGLHAWMQRYLEWLRVKNYSERTVENRHLYLGYFIAWCAERGIARPVEVTRPILERYQRMLFHYRKPSGKPLSFRSQHSRLVPVRAYFKWLTRQNVLLANPASELELPRLEKRLPKHVLTAAEAEHVVNQANVDENLGVRDRAILETLYSTGIRRMEVIGLSLFDLDVERGTLMVRQGKGKKDRMIPIGDRAVAWIEKYVTEVRPGLVVEPDSHVEGGGTLFLTNTGDPFTPNRLTQLVRNYVDAAAIGKRGACHLFRHTMATIMLENGADIRFIQEMLGHAELSTTQIYTQVSIKKLKEIHTATHPSARVSRERAVAADDDAGDDAEPEA
jgi:integrase/recombinase XerD